MKPVISAKELCETVHYLEYEHIYAAGDDDEEDEEEKEDEEDEEGTVPII